MKLKLSILIVLSCFIINKIQAQQVENNTEAGEIIRMLAASQDVPFLSFQLTTIVEDSVSQPGVISQADTVTGIYKQSGARYWAMFDSVEYVQGYNYNIALYHREKLIAVGKPSINNPVLQLSLLDSIFQQVHVKSMSVTQLDSVRRSFKIEFNIESPYSGYEIQYDMNSYEVYSITYYLKNGYQREDGTTSTARITATLKNYSNLEFSADCFIEDRFLYKDTQGFKPKPDYAGYQIITTADGL